MDEQYLKQFLERVSSGQLTVGDALQQLRRLPYEDLGFAKVDHHRELRTGIGEMIYCAGKTPEQARDIARVLLEQSTGPLLATKAAEAHAKAISEVAPSATWHENARLVVVRPAPPAEQRARILVITAGTSDIPVGEEAALTVEALGHEAERLYDVGAAGIHRLAASRDLFATANVPIVCAGMDGILPTIVAGMVGGPVIAVPTSIGYGAGAGGITPLLTMLNACAPGVAVVNIDNGFGAAILAYLIVQPRHQGAN
jgi:NCAIR mutase (PurE)-related protein